MYILLWHDTHVDAEVYGFTSFEDAKQFAKDRCADVYVENGYSVTYPEIDECMKTDGWLFFAEGKDFYMRVEKLNEV